MAEPIIPGTLAWLQDRIDSLERQLAEALVHGDGSGGHRYYGTYCRHDNHEICKLVCKTCSSPCVCDCHTPTT